MSTNHLQVTNAGDVEFTMTFTMKLKDWLAVRNAINDTRKYHSTAENFATEISSMVDQAQRVYYPKEESKRNCTL